MIRTFEMRREKWDIEVGFLEFKISSNQDQENLTSHIKNSESEDK